MKWKLKDKRHLLLEQFLALSMALGDNMKLLKLSMYSVVLCSALMSHSAQALWESKSDWNAKEVGVQAFHGAAGCVNGIAGNLVAKNIIDLWLSKCNFQLATD